jgi:hypothetical protein
MKDVCCVNASKNGVRFLFVEEQGVIVMKIKGVFGFDTIGVRRRNNSKMG